LQSKDLEAAAIGSNPSGSTGGPLNRSIQRAIILPKRAAQDQAE
jgi:hypothetical protein